MNAVVLGLQYFRWTATLGHLIAIIGALQRVHPKHRVLGQVTLFFGTAVADIVAASAATVTAATSSQKVKRSCSPAPVPAT